MCPSMAFAFWGGGPSRRSEQMRAQPVVLGHCGVCLGSRVGVRWEKHLTQRLGRVDHSQGHPGEYGERWVVWGCV